MTGDSSSEWLDDGETVEPAVAAKAGVDRPFLTADDVKLGDIEDLTPEEIAAAVAAQEATAAATAFDAVVEGEFPDEPQIHVV